MPASPPSLCGWLICVVTAITASSHTGRWGAFPNPHASTKPFAAGFGHVLAQLLTLPLYIAITGSPGAPDVLGLARSALTHLRYGNVVLLFHSRQDSQRASAT